MDPKCETELQKCHFIEFFVLIKLTPIIKHGSIALTPL